MLVNKDCAMATRSLPDIEGVVLRVTAVKTDCELRVTVTRTTHCIKSQNTKPEKIHLTFIWHDAETSNSPIGVF